MGYKILIVDDAAFMRSLLRRILESNGHQVIGEAENGAVGAEKFKELKPDLVFLDITMPQMDGITSLKLIKEADPNSKVIMCSAMAQRPMVIQALKIGADDFVEKPFREERIVEAINMLSGGGG